MAVGAVVLRLTVLGARQGRRELGHRNTGPARFQGSLFATNARARPPIFTDPSIVSPSLLIAPRPLTALRRSPGAIGRASASLRASPGADSRALYQASTPAELIGAADTSGRFAGAALAYKDVTDFMRALEVKEEFVASVSHELRTPLTSIHGFTSLILERERHTDWVAAELEGQRA